MKTMRERDRERRNKQEKWIGDGFMKMTGVLGRKMKIKAWCKGA